MSLRLLIIITFLMIGIAALSRLNPGADNTLQPLRKAVHGVQTWFREGASQQAETGRDDTREETDGAIRVYKWQDQDGQWHFSNEAPPAGVSSRVQIYRNDSNITQAPKVRSPEASSSGNTTQAPLAADPLMPITQTERVIQLMEDARGVQELMDQRQQRLEDNAVSR